MAVRHRRRGRWVHSWEFRGTYEEEPLFPLAYYWCSGCGMGPVTYIRISAGGLEECVPPHWPPSTRG
jgi:hypothetical protein